VKVRLSGVLREIVGREPGSVVRIEVMKNYTPIQA
jgi:hypothetical protein